MGIEPELKKKILQNYKDQKIAIYGIGIETENLLRELGRDIEIAGLLDSFREEGCFYGCPVISMQEAAEAGVKLIVAAARPGSCRAIAKRIGRLCMAKQISLIDIRGNNLCDQKKVSYDLKGMKGIKKQDLRRRMQTSQVISIDLFDTLVMRRVLFPADVIELTGRRLMRQGVVIDDFLKKRLASEKELARTGAPVLTEIYSHMMELYGIAGIDPAWLAEQEWQTDLSLILPRGEMCGLLAEMREQGKEIYIVSDTYYTKEQLVKLLDHCQVDSYTDILASCDYQTSKSGRLFERLQKKIGEKSCIHIGDDLAADIENAQKNGLETCQIPSGADLFEEAGCLGIRDSIESLSGRIKAGLFVSRLFNSPFQFEEDGCKISAADAYEIGFLFFAPMISDFVLWLDRQIQKRQIRNVWFCARDGYLIKKLYDELQGKDASVYFLTSRTAAVSAGMESAQDICYVEKMRFGGTIQEQMQERFGISISGGTGESLMPYAQDILKAASTNKKNYQKYISSLQTGAGETAFFDFVSKGTSQKYLQRLVKNHLKGFYFLQIEKDYTTGEELDISSFYRTKDLGSGGLFDSYYILETILTSPMPSVKTFDEEGRPCYAEETRSKKDIRCILSVQKGIEDYFRVYTEICARNGLGDSQANDPKNILEADLCEDKKAAEQILSLIHHIFILDEDFLNLKVEDPFFHRVTDMLDLI
ncbi:hypothetical protein AALC16_11345 [Lachnospiraceae bacterium 29-91]|nr:hypothetical protein C808_03776 [Lachnospiraceae bacterium M18-1]